MWLLVGAGVALAAGVSAVLVADTSRLSGDDRGVTAAAFRLPDIRSADRTVALADFRGRPVVLNFWSTSCGPCRKEMPALESVSARYRDRVAFVGVDHEDTQAGALRFLATTGVRYPVGFDPPGATAEAYRLRGLPTTVFIQGDGRVLLRHTGPLTRAQLLEGVRALLAAR
jgi:cytochrome c biogenesis protein CcmG/thiol:disulfide interchange protein DsbE